MGKSWTTFVAPRFQRCELWDGYIDSKAMIIPGHKDGCLLLEQAAFSSKVAFFLRMSDLHFPVSFFFLRQVHILFFHVLYSHHSQSNRDGKIHGKIAPSLDHRCHRHGAIDTVPGPPTTAMAIPWVSNGLTSLLAVVCLDDLCGSPKEGEFLWNETIPLGSCETWCWCHKNVIDLTWMDQVVKLSSCHAIPEKYRNGSWWNNDANL